jgi:hypothetical protein
VYPEALLFEFRHDAVHRSPLAARGPRGLRRRRVQLLRLEPLGVGVGVSGRARCRRVFERRRQLLQLGAVLGRRGSGGAGRGFRAPSVGELLLCGSDLLRQRCRVQLRARESE